jgi:predicted RND superfamily exporter protein
MANIRNRIEKWFENYAHTICRNRIKTIMITLFITATFVSQIPKIQIDTSTEGFLHDSDPALVAYNAFRDQFGRDEVIIIAKTSQASSMPATPEVKPTSSSLRIYSSTGRKTKPKWQSLKNGFSQTRSMKTC